MSTPHFPLICIDKHGLDIIPDIDAMSKTVISALIDPSIFNDLYFLDASGNKWTHTRASNKYKNTFLVRLLARTFYNPRIDSYVIWKPEGVYTIEELKHSIKECVDKDDDIITQFEEGPVIKQQIDAATSFDDIIAVLNKYVFRVNEEQLWKEQEARGDNI